MATAATGTRTLLVSGTGCIGVTDSNVQFLKRLLGSNVAAEVGGLQPFSSPGPGEQSCAPANVPQSPPSCCLPGAPSPCPGSEEGPGHPPVAPTDTPCLWEQSGGDTLPGDPHAGHLLSRSPGTSPSS